MPTYALTVKFLMHKCMLAYANHVRLSTDSNRECAKNISTPFAFIGNVVTDDTANQLQANGKTERYSQEVVKRTRSYFSKV